MGLPIVPRPNILIEVFSMSFLPFVIEKFYLDYQEICDG